LTVDVDDGRAGLATHEKTAEVVPRRVPRTTVDVPVETARREGRSMQEVARAAITEYVTRRSQRRDDHLAAIVQEDAELLRRLGSM